VNTFAIEQFGKEKVRCPGKPLSEITQLQITQFSMDLAHQLQRIYLAGFEMETFDRFPKCVGVVRDNCIAMLVPGVDGFQILGTPGWRMGESIGVLVEKEGRQVFQHKEEIVEATPERLEALQRFRADLSALLKDQQNTQ
jgi:hypothetical protein